MAYFAQLDSNSIVINVISIDSAQLLDTSGNESEDLGISICKQLLGSDSSWRQTSYSSSYRKNYAGIGYTYDETLDAFIPPQPFPSWTLNTDTCLWEPPSPYPSGGELYRWDETTLSWIQEQP